MKQLNHVMVDLETEDTEPTAKILSIGAVIFDPRFNKIDMKNTFYIELNTKLQKDRTTSTDTMEWWKKQSPQSRKVFNGKGVLREALDDLEFWLPKDCRVWANGPLFDTAMLENAYKQYGDPVPWHYWNTRCCRTIKDMYESRRGGTGSVNYTNNHNALRDAINQARMVCKMWKTLVGDK